MKTLFDLKHYESYDVDIYDRMKERASILLNKQENGDHTQAIVLYTTKKREYSRLIKDALNKDSTDVKALFEELREAGDTTVLYILSMWSDMCIDIPSFAFRERLLELDPSNGETRFFVLTPMGVSVLKISATTK